MSDLVAFVKARLDEDEQTARVVEDAPGEALSWYLVSDLQTPVVRTSPARVLAEVDAKRRIIAEHGPHDRWKDECRTCGCPDSCGCAGGVDFPCDTLRHLAAVYAQHPEYDERWRP